ncbi:MAG: helicase HerA-like domain-containing protein, partial [Bacillota bacterium]
LLKAGMQVVVIDPLDVWWGLRASADGEGPGLPVVVLGGAHGDLPLDATTGALIADLVVEEGISVVLSLRHLSKSDQRRFVTDLAERLYHRKGEDRYRQPMHLVIDEADAFVPQKVYAGQERMVGAIDDIVRRGRASGIGVTLITQRAAVISKDVLTQTEVLVALRTISPQDRKAVEAWIEAHDAEGRRHEFMESLASLPVGTAWFWSPGWLDIFKRVQIRRRETFDSSATPKVGETPRTPRQMASIDLERVRERLQAVMERVGRDDPKELRRRIAELERQLAARPAPQPVVERVEVPVLDPSVVDKLREVVEQLRGPVEALNTAFAALTDAATRLERAGTKPAVKPTTRPASLPSAPRPAPEPAPAQNGAVSLRAGERRMLATLARRHPLRLTRAQLGTLSGLTPSGGTFNTYLGVLKRHGFVTEGADGLLEITPAGFAHLGADVPPAPSEPAEVLEMWRGALRAGERRMLDELVAVYPRSLTRAELGEKTGIVHTGGTFGTYLGVLRRNGLIEVDGERVRASATLFM